MEYLDSYYRDLSYYLMLLLLLVTIQILKFFEYVKYVLRKLL